MQGIKLTKMVELTLDADQWGMFSDMVGVNSFVKDLNLTVERGFNNGATMQEVHQQAVQLMQVNREYGAMDTEPLRFLEELLEALYRN